MPYDMVEYMVFDAAKDVKRTQEGYLVATPRVARTGIQHYRGAELGKPNVEVVRIYRPDSEVFGEKAFRSFAHKPVTLEHPPELVTADNWKKYAVGQVGDEVIRDGSAVRVPMMLQDANAIREVESGRSQLSAGYTMELDWTPGVSPSGEAYDAAQRSISINHIAVTKAARGGSTLRIGDAYIGDFQTQQGVKDMPGETTTTILIGDKRVTVAEDAAPIILHAMKALNDANSALTDSMKDKEDELEKLKAKKKEEEDSGKAKDSKIAELTTVVTTKDAEIATLKQTVVDSALTPAKLDLIVKDRAEIINKAKAMLGDKLVTDGQTNTQIMKQVVDARVGAAAKEWAENDVRVSFDTLTVATKTPDVLANAISRAMASPSYSADSLEDAYEARSKFLADAWKTPMGTAAAKQ